MHHKTRPRRSYRKQRGGVIPQIVRRTIGQEIVALLGEEFKAEKIPENIKKGYDLYNEFEDRKQRAIQANATRRKYHSKRPGAFLTRRVFTTPMTSTPGSDTPRNAVSMPLTTLQKEELFRHLAALKRTPRKSHMTPIKTPLLRRRQSRNRTPRSSSGKKPVAAGLMSPSAMLSPTSHRRSRRMSPLKRGSNLFNGDEDLAKDPAQYADDVMAASTQSTQTPEQDA